jgi:hypothetical protein
MTDSVKVLGQSNPSATTLTTLYTVPASRQTTCSSLVVCNQAASAATFRVSIRVAGVADTAQQYLYYNQTIAAYSTFIATIGITLATTDVVSIYASSATMSFNLFGVEVA